MTELQGFNAMAKLFQIYYDLDSSGDIGGILGSMAFLQNKRTAGAAMLEHWTESLDIILKNKKTSKDNYFTPLQVFLAAGDYLEGFFGTTDISSEIKFIQQNAKLAVEHEKVDQVLWKNWLKCVEEVLSVKDSRMYFRLRPKN